VDLAGARTLYVKFEAKQGRTPDPAKVETDRRTDEQTSADDLTRARARGLIILLVLIRFAVFFVAEYHCEEIKIGRDVSKQLSKRNLRRPTRYHLSHDENGLHEFISIEQFREMVCQNLMPVEKDCHYLRSHLSIRICFPSSRTSLFHRR
jgi:hypothetical protein